MDGSERGIVKHFHSIMSNFTARTAAESSSLKMVILFSGVKRDFPITKAQCTEPCSSTIRRYEHTAYACWEVSEKWCNCNFTKCPNPDGLKHLETDIVERSGNSGAHDCRILVWSDEIESSQPQPFLTSSWRTFGASNVGATKPSGSKIELIAESSCLRLVGAEVG